MEQAREQAQHHLRRESISLPKRILYRCYLIEELLLLSVPEAISSRVCS